MRRSKLGFVVVFGIGALLAIPSCGGDDGSDLAGGNAGAPSGGTGGTSEDAGNGGTGGSAGAGGEAGTGGVSGGAGTGGSGGTAGIGGSGGTAGTGGSGGMAGTGGSGGTASGGAGGTAGMGGSGGTASGGTGGGPACVIQTSLTACDDCINTQCIDECNQCAQNPECLAIWTCIMQDCAVDGGPPSQQCATTCATSHFNGLMDFGAFWQGLSPGCVANKCQGICPTG